MLIEEKKKKRYIFGSEPQNCQSAAYYSCQSTVWWAQLTLKLKSPLNEIVRKNLIFFNCNQSFSGLFHWTVTVKKRLSSAVHSSVSCIFLIDLFKTRLSPATNTSVSHFRLENKLFCSEVLTLNNQNIRD
jgi:hypothetical protein